MASENNLKLELVQVLFRHGARTCSMSEAKIPMPDYVDQSLHEAYDYEQLTNTGKGQAHRLGQVLRERYGGFLGEVYRPREVYAYSSNFDRTKMSLQLVLAGLYPPSDEQTWNPGLKWMPIPFHYAPREIDVLLQTFRKSKYVAHLREALQSEKAKEHESKLMEMHPFFKEKGIHALEKFKFIAGMGIYNVLYIHKTANSPLPSWFTDDLYETMKQHVINYLDLMSLTTEMKKLNCGALIKKWIENMNLEKKVINPRKIYLYSGHELNIAAFTRTHGAQEQFKYPFFSSAVVLEKLRDPNNRVYVRLLAWTGEDDKFITLKLGKFEEFCPIEEYLKLVEEFLPSEDEINSLLHEDIANLREILTTDIIYKSKLPEGANKVIL